MAKLNLLVRYGRIINKLSGHCTYIPADELLKTVGGEMGEDSVTLRTLQRDLIVLRDVFNVDIRFRRGRGYYIVERTKECDAFEKLLTDYTILSLTGTDALLREYILPEHRKMTYSVDIGSLIGAIRDRRKVVFNYYLARQNEVRTYQIAPYYLKESQLRWYLIGYRDDGQLRMFELGRFQRMNVTSETFVRNDSVDIPALFRESFGIWSDPEDPVEEIILKYDALDGRFIKTLPLHTSQQILEESESGVTVRLRLRVTNDFVMELLSRSRSVEIIKPEGLRRRLHDIYAAALERNKVKG